MSSIRCFWITISLAECLLLSRSISCETPLRGSFDTQKQLIADYKEDIRKYATGIDQTRIINVFQPDRTAAARKTKIQISKVASGARFRDYRGMRGVAFGCGMVNICYCMEFRNCHWEVITEPDTFKLYFADTGLLVSMLDDESQEDLRANKNLRCFISGSPL